MADQWPGPVEGRPRWAARSGGSIRRQRIGANFRREDRVKHRPPRPLFSQLSSDLSALAGPSPSKHTPDSTSLIAVYFPHRANLKIHQKSGIPLMCKEFKPPPAEEEIGRAACR